MRSPIASRRPAKRLLRLLAGATVAVAIGSLPFGCGVDLGTDPFTCTDSSSCPEGFTCQATLCVATGSALPISRPMRVTYINSAEMYWFASLDGGATLLVNDGFSPGAEGIYEMHVSEAGVVTGPKKLLAFDGEFATSSAIVALDDTHYGAVTLDFPSVDQQTSTLRLHSLARETTTPEVDEVIFEESVPYLGGYEPPYISALVRDGELLTALTDPSAGGQVLFERRSITGHPISNLRIPLPAEILPFSGDCLLWKTPEDGVMLRLGLEKRQVFSIDVDNATATAATAITTKTAIYGFGKTIEWLEDDGDGNASYVLRDLSGKEIGTGVTSSFPDGLEPYTGVSNEEGAVISPFSDDESFKTIEVKLFGTDGSAKTVATIDRNSDDSLYSSRAFVSGGHVYVAWTSFHDSLMDLWVATTSVGGTVEDTPVAAGGS